MGNVFGWIQDDQSRVAIKERFRRFSDVLEPGFRCLPWFLGSQIAGYLCLRLQQLDVRCETETKEGVFANVVASAMSAYGCENVQTLIVDTEPDERVKQAMNEINAANEKAEAENILPIKKAEGEAKAKYLSGLGIARQRQAIVEGLRDSVLDFSVNVPGRTAKDVTDMVLASD